MMNHYGGGGYGTQNQNQNQNQSSNNQQQQKHDVFVGNLAFSTTEEQLHQAFSEIGRILKVRMVSDLETGKPRGFAFIEFEDPQAALSAIRNMNDYELNGRRIRVNFSNSSHLETLAGKLGMDMSQAGNSGGNKNDDKNKDKDNKDGSSKDANVGSTTAISDALKSFTKLEMYDVISQFKELADKDPDEARKLLSGHPQLPEAILHLMSKLDMIKTPIDGTNASNLLNPAAVAIVAPVPPPPPTSMTVPPQPPNKPSGMPSDPRQQQHPSDPRARADPRRQDPRQQQQPPPNFAHPPPMFQQPPPNFAQPPPMNVVPPPAVPGLNATLVQQVMSLTPQQISQLPPDKQQSILSLRNQITQQMAAGGAR